MPVPTYHRSKTGKVFKLTRISEWVDATTARYVLRATPLPTGDGIEVSSTEDANELLDRIALHQVIVTPEQTFERLWQQLRVDLESD